MAKKAPRIIPATMVTQHPDHASIPFWHSEAFISAAAEPQECFVAFSELGAGEYKWDWEGKLVDESVVERLLTDHFDYFREHPLGKEKFLTFRLPNPKVETEYRLGRAFMGMISAASLAKHVGYDHSPMFEVILPMTETAEEMIGIQEAFSEIVALKHPLLKHDESFLRHIDLIPLFEQVDIITDSANILERYLVLHKKIFGFLPTYIRPYLARSDPALNAGIIPTVLSIKIALSRFKAFEQEHNIPLYPIIGAAALPFRGGLTPDHIDDFIQEYQGIRTTTIQSGFKYDYPKAQVIAGFQKLNTTLPEGIAATVSESEEKIIGEVIKAFEIFYKEAIEDVAPVVNDIAAFIPRRRERVQHVGLFGYSRGVGKVKLPRAIGFTAAMYSLGIPPELVGSGRGLALATEKGWISVIEQYYVNLKKDLQRSGAFLNKDNLSKLAKQSIGWKRIAEDIKAVETYLGQELGPSTVEEKQHQELTSKIVEFRDEKKDITEYIRQAAVIRKSLG